MALRELKLVLEEYSRHVTDLKEVFMITEDDVIFFAEIGECNKLTVVNLIIEKHLGPICLDLNDVIDLNRVSTYGRLNVFAVEQPVAKVTSTKVTVNGLIFEIIEDDKMLLNITNESGTRDDKLLLNHSTDLGYKIIVDNDLVNIVPILDKDQTDKIYTIDTINSTMVVKEIDFKGIMDIISK